MKYYILGEEIAVRDWTSIGQSREFVESDNQISLTVSSVKLYGRARQIVYDWVYDQTDGYGRHGNIPVEAIPQTGQTLQMYLDIKTVLEISDVDITTNLVMRKCSNHFFAGAQVLTFQALNDAGWLSGFTQVPYQIMADTTKLERLILLGHELILLIQLAQAAFELIKLAADGLDIVGTGVLTALGKIVAYGLWVVGLLAITIQQGIQLKNIYAPPIRNLLSMSDYDLIKAGCEYLGFQFESTFIEERRYVETLPVTEQQPGKSIFKLFEYQMPDTIFNKGYPRFGDTIQYLIDLINFWLKFYNTEIKIFNGVVRIETPEFFAINADVTLETALSDQDKVQRKYRFNQGEKRNWRRKFLTWTTDPQDIHTLDISSHSISEYQTQNIKVLAGCEDLFLLTGFVDLQAPFGLLRRKDELFPLEKMIYKFFKLLDKLANAFGGNSNLASNFIDDRIGIGIISNQFFGVTKKIINTGNGRQPENYLSLYLNTDIIYEERHKDLEVKAASAIWEDMRVPMHPNTFNALQANNYAFLDTGESVKVISCKHYEEVDHRYSDITIQRHDESGFNTKTVKIE